MRNYVRLAYCFASLLRHTRRSRKRLDEYRDKRFRKIVSYAYEHSPFYHTRFRDLQLDPSSIRGIADIRKLPVLSRSELQANAKDLISDEYDLSKLRIARTSGSTGLPFFTYLSEKEYDLRQAKQLRPHYICGHRPRDRWVLICPPEHSGNVSSIQSLFHVYSPIPVSIFDGVSEQAKAINRIIPEVLDGYSSSLLLIAKHVKQTGAVDIRPKMCMSGAELFHPSDRAFVEQVFGVPCFDQYGSEELGRIAWQCEVDGAYHLDFDTLVTEFHSADGEEVSPGEEGQVVCTSLFNYAMPILRYDLGDAAIPCSADEVCECGRAFPLMKMVAGRSEEAIALPDGRVIAPLAIGDSMCEFKFFSDVLQYRFVQKSRESFRVLVKRRLSGVSEDMMGAELVSHLRRTLRLPKSEAELEVEFVEEIPPDKSGKIRKVVSEI